jgi:predicted MFS family arabinose efflux permease
VKRPIAAIATAVVLVGATVALAASSPIGTYTTTITGKGANTLKGALD